MELNVDGQFANLKRPPIEAETAWTPVERSSGGRSVNCGDTGMVTPPTKTGAGSMDGNMEAALAVLKEAFKVQMEYLEKSTPLRTGTDQARSSRQSG